MAGERTDNLMPIEEVNSKRTREKHSKDSAKAGKASAASRRRKKTAREQMEMLLSLPVTSEKNRAVLAAIGLNPDDADNMTMLTVSTYKKALTGDARATELVVNGFGMGEWEKERLKIQQDQLKLQREELNQKNREQELLASIEYKGIPSLMIIPKYAEVLRDITNHDHNEYVLQIAFESGHLCHLLRPHQDIISGQAVPN